MGSGRLWLEMAHGLDFIRYCTRQRRGEDSSERSQWVAIHGLDHFGSAIAQNDGVEVRGEGNGAHGGGWRTSTLKQGRQSSTTGMRQSLPFRILRRPAIFKLSKRYG